MICKVFLLVNLLIVAQTEIAPQTQENQFHNEIAKTNENIEFITTVRNIDDFVLHDGEKHIEHIYPVADVNGFLHYSIGARTHSDRLVASGGQNNSWPAPHNVNVRLTYPSQGYGAIVTYVAIVVNQTSNLGRAYVVNGGINQRMISVVVEAIDTYCFNYMAYIYGV